MSSIEMYLEPEDTGILLNWLNNDDEIAFFKSLGPKKWIAVKTIDKLKTENLLWHVPYKNLPLIKGYPKEPGIIEDPWRGWDEVHDNKTSIPYFGSIPGIIELNVLTNRFFIDENNKPVDLILISSFGWIGNHYRVLGRPALKETELWWKNLRKKIKGSSEKITLRYDNQGKDGYQKREIYAFPQAIKAIEDGKTILNTTNIFFPPTYEKRK